MEQTKQRIDRAPVSQHRGNSSTIVSTAGNCNVCKHTCVWRPCAHNRGNTGDQDIVVDSDAAKRYSPKKHNAKLPNGYPQTIGQRHCINPAPFANRSTITETTDWASMPP